MVQAPLSPIGRLIVAGVGVGLLSLLVLASRVQPDPRGFGTHEQLGLTPCSFYRWTGVACPTCGATTAWAYVVRGQLASAVHANLAGTLLCLAAMVCVPWLWLSAARGRWLIRQPTIRSALLLASGLTAIAVLDWGRRLWL